MQSLGPELATLAALAIGTLAGLYPVRKAIAVKEAKHELRQGSAGFLRGIAGWTVIAFWIMSLWFCGTVLGDWYVLGDFETALRAAELRLWILIELAAALSD